MSGTEQFVQAKSDNLPKIDSWMIAEFFSKNDCFSSFELRGVKENRSGRESYGDNAIGFVEINRSNNICTVRCKICPEHRVKKKNYTVVLKVDEGTNKVISVTCLDCAAASGGCKHAVAFIMWTHRRSEEPSPTTVECYWTKPRLATVGTSIKFLTAKDFGAEDPLNVDEGNEFLDDVLHSLKTNKIESQLLKYYEVKSGVDLLDLHQILIRFKEDMSTDFFQYCTNLMSDVLCREAASKTVDQYKSKLWFRLRYARITASKLYDVAHCKKVDGIIVDQILGNFKLRDNLALERGRRLESLVLKAVEKEMKIKFSHTGLLLNKDHPVLGASPDAISEEYIVEIKCPSSLKSTKNYIKKDNTITAKYNAQVQLEMYFAKKCKALYCIADPEFEINSKINIVHVLYDKECVEGLIMKAESFWLKNILPIVLKSVEHVN